MSILYRLRRAWGAFRMPIPRADAEAASWHEWRSDKDRFRCLVDMPVVAMLADGSRGPVKLDLNAIRPADETPVGWSMEDWN